MGRGNVTPSGVEREREREMLFEIQSISPSVGRTDGRTDRARPTFGRKNDGKERGREGGSER